MADEHEQELKEQEEQVRREAEQDPDKGRDDALAEQIQHEMHQKGVGEAVKDDIKGVIEDVRSEFRDDDEDAER